MALHNHNGKIYCDASDLDFHLSWAALHQQLKRARARGEGAPYENIKNPKFNGTGSKNWVLLESLPIEVRTEVERKLRGAELLTREALDTMEKEGAPSQEIAAATTQITADTILLSATYLKKALKNYIDNYYRNYVEHYLEQGHILTTSRKQARTCSFAMFLYEQEVFLGQQAKTAKQADLFMRSLHSNTLQVLSLSYLDVAVPASQRRYLPWWAHVQSQLVEGKEIQSIIHPLRTENHNAFKLAPKVCHYLEHLYVTGASLPKTQIHEMLLKKGKEMGWFLKNGRYSPPTYSAVSKYLQGRQSDLVLGRSGEGKMYDNYLATASRQMPTERNAIWGADATAKPPHFSHYRCDGSQQAHHFAQYRRPQWPLKDRDVLRRPF